MAILSLSVRKEEVITMREKKVLSGVSMLLTGVLFMGVLSMLEPHKVFAAPKADVQVENEAKVVNLNKATAEELQTLRGIGPALAERVIEFRNQNGPFKKLEDLMNVRGIGEAKFEKLRSQISI